MKYKLNLPKNLVEAIRKNSLDKIISDSFPRLDSKKMPTLILTYKGACGGFIDLDGACIACGGS